MSKVQLHLVEGARVLGRCAFDEPLVLGRQDQGEPSPTDNDPLPFVIGANPKRVVIAPSPEKRISRRHVQVEPLDGFRVRLTNLSDTRSVRLETGEELSKQGETLELRLPVVVHLGSRSI